MADNIQKKIEEVKMGEEVQSYDHKIKQSVVSKVNKLAIHNVNQYYVMVFDDNSVLKVTKNHPLYTEDGWKAIAPSLNSIKQLNATELKMGDYVIAKDGKKRIMGWIEVNGGPYRVYNLQDLDVAKTYYANDILVHNAKCLLGETLIKTPRGFIQIKDLKVGDTVYGKDEEGKEIITEVVETYKKETLNKMNAKVLKQGVVATNNHLIMANNQIVSVGSLNYPDVVLDSAVYDIKTKSGNYIIDGDFVSIFDELPIFEIPVN